MKDLQLKISKIGLVILGIILVGVLFWWLGQEKTTRFCTQTITTIDNSSTTSIVCEDK